MTLLASVELGDDDRDGRPAEPTIVVRRVTA
jgi:hypothetical protein